MTRRSAFYNKKPLKVVEIGTSVQFVCTKATSHDLLISFLKSKNPEFSYSSVIFCREHAIEKEPSLALLSIWPPVWRCVFSGQCIMARVQTRQRILTIQFFIHLDTKSAPVHRLLLCFVLPLLFSLFCHSLFLFVSCHLKPFRLFLLSLNLCLSFYFTPILYDEAFLGITMGIKFGVPRTVLPRISSKPSCDSEGPSNNKIYLVASYSLPRILAYI